jgi:hypothetical protein
LAWPETSAANVPAARWMAMLPTMTGSGVRREGRGKLPTMAGGGDRLGGGGGERGLEDVPAPVAVHCPPSGVPRAARGCPRSYLTSGAMRLFAKMACTSLRAEFSTAKSWRRRESCCGVMCFAFVHVFWWA